MKQILGIIIALTLCASQVAALSCMRPDVAESYNRAATSEDEYVVLLGTFDFDTPQQRSTDSNAPDTLRAVVQFSGTYLSASGFTAAPPLAVTLVFNCAGPWCGSLPSDGPDVLAFVQQTADGYILDVEPCGGTAFIEPDAKDIARVEDCMHGGTCAPLDR